MRYLGKTVTVWSDAGEFVTGTVLHEIAQWGGRGQHGIWRHVITVETLSGGIVGGPTSLLKPKVREEELICATSG